MLPTVSRLSPPSQPGAANQRKQPSERSAKPARISILTATNRWRWRTLHESAADNIDRIKSELVSLKADAESLGMEIDPLSDTVLPGPKVRNPMEAELTQSQLQPRLNTIVAEANLA
jgi:hypothetical protein